MRQRTGVYSTCTLISYVHSAIEISEMMCMLDQSLWESLESTDQLPISLLASIHSLRHTRPENFVNFDLFLSFILQMFASLWNVIYTHLVLSILIVTILAHVILTVICPTFYPTLVSLITLLFSKRFKRVNKVEQHKTRKLRLKREQRGPKSIVLTVGCITNNGELMKNNDTWEIRIHSV